MLRKASVERRRSAGAPPDTDGFFPSRRWRAAASSDHCRVDPFFDEAVEMGKGPLKAGDVATSRGQLCTVLEIDYEADTCKLGFAADGVEVAAVLLVKGATSAGDGRRRGPRTVAHGLADRFALPPGEARLAAAA